MSFLAALIIIYTILAIPVALLLCLRLGTISKDYKAPETHLPDRNSDWWSI